MTQYLPDYEWFLIDAMLGPPVNDNFLYEDIKEFSCTLENFRCSLIGREPLPIYHDCPPPDFSPTHKKRGDGQDPAFGCDNAHSLAGFGGDDAA